MTTARTILVPIDFTAASLAALQHARDIADESGGRVHLLHVVSGATNAPWAASRTECPVLDQGQFGVLNQLATLMVSHRMAPFRTTATIRAGAAAHVIPQFAAEIHADLIVLGVHRRVPIGRVVEAVTRNAPCRVLTIPEPFTEVPHARLAPGVRDAIAC